MSQSVANALEMQGRFYTTSTRNFIRTFDRTFDCLNVSKIKQVVKNDLKPYFNMGDPTFQVVYFFIKLTYSLCAICVCLIPIKCYFKYGITAWTPTPFVQSTFSELALFVGDWKFTWKRDVNVMGVVNCEIGRQKKFRHIFV